MGAIIASVEFHPIMRQRHVAHARAFSRQDGDGEHSKQPERRTVKYALR